MLALKGYLKDHSPPLVVKETTVQEGESLSQDHKSRTGSLWMVHDLQGTVVPMSAGRTRVWGPPVVQKVKNLPVMQETWVSSLGREDPLEKGMATHSSILAWRILWTEEPRGLQSIGMQSQTKLSDFTLPGRKLHWARL